jgi:hypothetical protein
MTVYKTLVFYLLSCIFKLLNGAEDVRACCVAQALTPGLLAGCSSKLDLVRHLFDAGRSSFRMVFLKIHWVFDDNPIRPVLFMGMGMWKWGRSTAAFRLIPCQY